MHLSAIIFRILIVLLAINFPAVTYAQVSPTDYDGDGIENSVDEDDDNDGVPDAVELTQGTDPLNPISFQDLNGNRVPDYFESLSPVQYVDTNEQATDEDGDTITDYEEAFSGQNDAPLFKPDFRFLRDEFGTDVSSAEAVASGDLDGDGDEDIVFSIAVGADRGLYMYRNNGTNVFDRNTLFEIAVGSDAPSLVRDILIVDLNDDNALDLVVASSADNSIRYYRNAVTLTPFEGVVSFPVDLDMVGVNSLIAADFNNDTKIDIAAASSFTGIIRWYENDGSDRPFVKPTMRTVATTARGVGGIGAADVNNDNRADIVAANADDNEVVAYVNGGSSTVFGSANSTKRTLVADLKRPVAMTVADFDFDGRADIAVANADDGTIRLLEYVSPNTYSERTVASGLRGISSISARDLDLDNDIDLYYARKEDASAWWLQNEGRSNFGNNAIRLIGRSLTDIVYLHAADANNDGLVDFLAAHGEFGLFTTLNNYKVEIEENKKKVMQIQASDVDGDDLIFSVVSRDDGRFFSIDKDSGVLSFINPPDFETPIDTDENNVYEIIVEVTDTIVRAQLKLMVEVTNDITPATFTQGFPRATMLSASEVVSYVNLDETGTVYYMVMVNDSTPPNPAEIMAGDASGNANWLRAANIEVTEPEQEFNRILSQFSFQVGVPVDIYFVQVDTEGNMPNSSTKFDVAPYDTDSDGDGVPDDFDDFPNDPAETVDTDGDGVGDNGDVFPNDVNETKDTDADGVGDNEDVFPNDPTEFIDTDLDGVGDNADAFPRDASETQDSDGDGVGNNADVFPRDGTETLDDDGDGVGNNADAFDDDPTETTDTDGDGVGDNTDVFPNDPTETEDLDNDGVGDNSDPDVDGDGVKNERDEFPRDDTRTGDLDADGIDNLIDPDMDGDGIPNIIDDDVDGDGILDSFQDNTQPSAIDDEVSVDSTEPVILNVLENDSDEDQDRLFVTFARAELGEVSIEDNRIVYRAPTEQEVQDVIEYNLTDGDQSSRAQVFVNVNTRTQQQRLLQLTAPPSVEVNASGLQTQVDLGIASAVDDQGFVLPVKLMRDNTWFAPGKHTVFWQATDRDGNIIYITQEVVVHPLVAFSKRQLVSEGDIVTLQVLLNGEAPEYPFEVSYTVRGSASEDDHSARDGSVVFTSGTRAEITFETYEDAFTEVSETIEFRFAGELNALMGEKHIVSLTEQNQAPSVELFARQYGKLRSSVAQNDGRVVISSIVDGREAAQYEYNWIAPSNIQDIDPITSSFSFLPSQVTPGIYQIGLELVPIDSNTPTVTEFFDFLLVDDLPQLSSLLDTDFDGFNDASEGYDDSDRDGIANYRDGISASNVLQSIIGLEQRYLLESDTGTSLRIGATNLAASDMGAQLLINDVIDLDTEYANTGGVFDYEIRDMAVPGQPTTIVLPQLEPIPEQAVYRKFSQANGWTDYVEDLNNQLASAPGAPGYCPPPDSANWTEGLSQGHWCIRLTIQDGGPNDADGIANATVVDPGGVASRVIAGNARPTAAADSVVMYHNTDILIDVLANDTDTDNEALTVFSVHTENAQVTIENNKLRFTPRSNFYGDLSIVYGIRDAQGAQSFANVHVQVLANTPPIAYDDLRATEMNRAVSLNVLENDEDPDGDNLIIESATSEFGETSINGDRIEFTPRNGFVGIATITYTINDGYPRNVAAVASVDVGRNYPPVVVSDTASTTDEQSILVDVLANDSDPEGRALSLSEVSTSSGTVSIESNKVRFIPQAGFEGSVAVTYIAADTTGNTSVGQLNISVTKFVAPPVVTPPTDNAGGGGGTTTLYGLFALLCLLVGRRSLQLRKQ